MEESMRRRSALLAALCLVLVLPASASAARATRATDHTVSISCDGISPVSGAGFAFFGASISDLNGPDAFLDAWNSSTPPDGPADISRDYEQPASVTWNGTTLSGSFHVVGATGVPIAGLATFSATLVPVGDPYTIDESFHDGNRKERLTGTGQTLQPSGTLTLPTGMTFDLANCFGDESTVSLFATNPNAFVASFSGRFLDCGLTDGSGNTGSLFVDLSETDGFVDALVFPAAAGAPDLEAVGALTIVGGTLDGSLDTFLLDTFEPVDIPSSIHLTATDTGERFRNILQNATERRVISGTVIDIEGTLAVGTYTFDLGACVGVDSRTKDVRTAPRGPKPGGKAPANDLPSGAKLLAIGASTTIQTKGASLDREATFECEVFEDAPGTTFEIPISNTVWYRFTGTGGLVTVDTAGSDYDTVVAIYTANASGGYTPVPGGCVDDVPLAPIGRTLQAKVTIPTVAGTTYYVQIGGFPEAFTYGNLKVSIK
jgi:hypothetical protein